jgi:hypothetical protein
MVDVKYIASTAEIPSGTPYVLVKYGSENLDTRHSRGITKTVEFPPEGYLNAPYEFANAVEAGRKLAESEAIPTVYVIPTY